MFFLTSFSLHGVFSRHFYLMLPEYNALIYCKTDVNVCCGNILAYNSAYIHSRICFGSQSCIKTFFKLFFLVLSSYGKCNASMHRWEHVSQHLCGSDRRKKKKGDIGVGRDDHVGRKSRGNILVYVLKYLNQGILSRDSLYLHLPQSPAQPGAPQAFTLAFSVSQPKAPHPLSHSPAHASAEHLAPHCLQPMSPYLNHIVHNLSRRAASSQESSLISSFHTI